MSDFDPDKPFGIGNGINEYNDQDEQAKAKKGGRKAPAQAGDDDSPLSDSNADEAIEQIGRMRSKDRLQHVIANDKRVTVQNAAKERLAQL